MTKPLYTKQLHADSLLTILPIIAGLVIMLSLLALIVYDGIVLPMITIGASLITVRWSRQLLLDDVQERAGVTFVVVHLLLVAVNWVQFWEPNSNIPYLFAIFIIISDAAIRPGAGIWAWLASLLLMIGGLAFRGGFGSLESLSSVLLITAVNFFLAILMRLLTIDWEIALEATNYLHLKARSRRDDLFKTQEALQRTNARFQFLNEQLETNVVLGRQVTSILDRDELVQEAVTLIGDKLKYGYVAIFLVDESKTHLIMQAEAGRTLTIRRGQKQLNFEQDGAICVAAVRREPVRVERATLEVGLYQDLLPGMESQLTLPLTVGKKLVGVLDVQSRRVGLFNDLHMLALQSVADQVAIAIQNANLYRLEGVRRQLAETMHQIGRILSATLDLEVVLNRILEYLVQVIPYERAAVMLYRDEALRFVAARGYPDAVGILDVVIPMQEPSKDDVYVKIYESKQPLVIPDVSQYSTWRQMDGLPTTRSWLGIPLIRDERVIGMLSLARETDAPYSSGDVTMATAFAGQAAIALANARLYSRVERFNQQLEYEVKQRTQALQEAYDQLEQMDRAKSDFIGVTSHELRTPLTLVQGYSSMLMTDAGIRENPYYEQLVTGINSGAVRLHEIVNYMLDMVKIDNRALELMWQTTDLHDVIIMVKKKFEQALKERNLTLVICDDVADLPDIEADKDALYKAFYHLMMNAIKYTPDGKQITVNGRLQADNSAHKLQSDSIEVFIEDNGIGIDPDYHELIFTKFYQTGRVSLHSSGKTKFKGGGPGLGLAIVKGIIELHGGHVWVDSVGYDEEMMPGSTFYVALPIHQRRAVV